MNLLRWLRRFVAHNGYRQLRESRTDSLTLAAQVGKPQAAGLTPDRIFSDRRVPSMPRRRTP